MKKPIPFGKYYLLERINVGGMAEVFRAKAFGVEGFERMLAVKRILPNIAEDEEFITMFIDEAKIAVQLQHANIAQIFDLGKVEDSFFIALEFVRGKDLRSIFDRGRQRGDMMPVAQACFIMMQVCEGLDYAHNKRDAQGRELNLVHRDISPQNVLIGYDGEIKLIDFGIAKAAGKASKTQAGILKGKFGYMSPEQVRGLPIDRRSDIFAVGICLYELLTGERLFVGESDFSTLEKVRNVEILPPSSYNRKIPEELERIVLKALAKDVDDRYQNAIDLHDDLQAFLYTVGEFYSRKDLAGWMKKTFASEIEEDVGREEQFRQFVAPTPGPSVSAAAPRKGVAAAGAGAKASTGENDMEWDDEELETQIFDKAPEHEEGGQGSGQDSGEDSGVELKSGEILLEEFDDRTVAGAPPPGLILASSSPTFGSEIGPASSPSGGGASGSRPFAGPPLGLAGVQANPRSTLIGVPVVGSPLPGRGGSVPTPIFAAASAPTPLPADVEPTPAEPPLPLPLPQAPLPRLSPGPMASFGGGGAGTDAEYLRRTSGVRLPRRSLYGGIAILAAVAAAGGFWAYKRANQPGQLVVTVTPADAVILIDDVKVAEKSPFTVERPPGSYTLSAARPGYVRSDQMIELAAGEPFEAKLALEASPDTGFELTSDPPGELVWLDGSPLMAPGSDGKMQQHRTDLRAQRIAPGKHVIEIKGNARFKEWKHEIELQPDVTTKIHAPLIGIDAVAAVASPQPAPARPPSAPRAGAPRSAESDLFKPSPAPARPRRASANPAPEEAPAPSPPARAPKAEKPTRVATKSSAAAPAGEFEMPLEETSSAQGAGDEGCSITVGSKPLAQVWINGKNTNRHTPLVDHKVPCGKHKIAFKRADLNIDQSFPLAVEAGVPFKKVYMLIDSEE